MPEGLLRALSFNWPDVITRRKITHETCRGDSRIALPLGCRLSPVVRMMAKSAAPGADDIFLDSIRLNTRKCFLDSRNTEEFLTIGDTAEPSSFTVTSKLIRRQIKTNGKNI